MQWRIQELTDGGGAFFQEIIPTTAGKAIFLYTLEGCGGMLPRNILKPKASNSCRILERERIRYLYG